MGNLQGKKTAPIDTDLSNHIRIMAVRVIQVAAGNATGKSSYHSIQPKHFDTKKYNALLNVVKGEINKQSGSLHIYDAQEARAYGSKIGVEMLSLSGKGKKDSLFSKSWWFSKKTIINKAVLEKGVEGLVLAVGAGINKAQKAVTSKADATAQLISEITGAHLAHVAEVAPERIPTPEADQSAATEKPMDRMGEMAALISGGKSKGTEESYLDFEEPGRLDDAEHDQVLRDRLADLYKLTGRGSK